MRDCEHFVNNSYPQNQSSRIIEIWLHFASTISLKHFGVSKQCCKAHKTTSSIGEKKQFLDLFFLEKNLLIHHKKNKKKISAAVLFILTKHSFATDLAKVSPGDSDSVAGIGEMQPRSDVYRTTRTTRFDTRLVWGVIALQSQTQTNEKNQSPTYVRIICVPKRDSCVQEERLTGTWQYDWLTFTAMLGGYWSSCTPIESE